MCSSDLNMSEPYVYKKNNGSAIVFLVLYVDDILLIENDVLILQSIKTWLSQKFFMKDLGEASYILDIMICRDRSNRMLGLSQSRYIDLMLKRFNVEGTKRGYLPIGHAYNSLRRCLLKYLKREIE